MKDHLERDTEGKLTAKQIELLADKDVNVKHFIDLYNLFELLLGKERLIQFRSQLMEAGWDASSIMGMETEAGHRSNWARNTFVKERVRSHRKKLQGGEKGMTHIVGKRAGKSTIKTVSSRNRELGQLNKDREISADIKKGWIKSRAV